MKIKQKWFATIVFILIISIGIFVGAGIKGYNYIAFSGMIPISIFVIIMSFCLKKKFINIEVVE